MKKKLLLVGLLAASSVVFADDFKLGYIDVDKIFTQAKPSLALQNALKSKYAARQKEIQSLNSVLVKDQEQMQGVVKKATSMDQLSATDKAKVEKLQAQFQKDQAAFQQKYVPFQQAVQRSQDYATSILLGHANTILKGLSEKGGYDLVLTSRQLVYAKPKYDLTDQVIKQLNDVKSQEVLDELSKAEAKAMSNPGLMSR